MGEKLHQIPFHYSHITSEAGSKVFAVGEYIHSQRLISKLIDLRSGYVNLQRCVFDYALISNQLTHRQQNRPPIKSGGVARYSPLAKIFHLSRCLTSGQRSER